MAIVISPIRRNVRNGIASQGGGSVTDFAAVRRQNGALFFCSFRPPWSVEEQKDLLRRAEP